MMWQRAIAEGGVDIVVFTASVQLLHLLAVARDAGLERAVREGLRRLIVASIGPMTSEELRRQQLPVDIEPSNPKMGVLINELAARCVLAQKQDAYARDEVGVR